MKTMNKVMLLLTILFTATFTSCNAQIKNAKTATFTVYGKCDMCKTRIEKVTNKKGISKGVWNADTKILTLNFDSTKTNADAILKNIAYAGHDNDLYLAPDNAYANLPACCHYDRKKVVAIVPPTDSLIVAIVSNDTIKPPVVVVNPMADVFTSYFALKDALTKDDATTASIKANELVAAIGKADMNAMNPEQHLVWMKYMDPATKEAKLIGNSKDLEKQREAFISLSKSMYEITKAFKSDTPLYLDFCPMANNGKGANWLSKDKKINNPYFGKQMPTCGSVQETIVK